MAQISEQNPENHAQPSPALPDDIGAGGAPAGSSLSPAASPPLPTHLQDLTDRARGYVEAASSANTRKAYASDWKHFTAWCRRQNLSALPPEPQVVGLYITACASGGA